MASQEKAEPQGRELSACLTSPDSQHNERATPAEPQGSIYSTGILLASSGMGAGMLTLPIAVQQAGPTAAISVYVVGVLLSIFSTVVLLMGCPRLQADTYGVVVDKSLGFQWKIFGLPMVDTFFCFYLLCCMVGFLIFIGDFLPAIGSSIPGFGWLTRGVAIALGAVVIATFTVFNSVHAIRHVASCGTFAVLFTAIVIIAESISRIHGQGDAISETWHQPVEFSLGTLQASGNIIFAFCIGSNVPAIAVELKEPTAKRTIMSAVFAHVIMLSFYGAIGFAGFFSFVRTPWIDPLDHTPHIGPHPDIIESYPKDDPWMTASRAMLTLTMLSVSVLNFVPAMKSFYIILAKVRGAQVNGEDEEHDPGFFIRAISVGSVSCICVVIALKLRQVSTFISWLGALFGAVELIFGPLVLMLYGHVGSLSKHGRIGILLSSLVIMLYLWTAAVADCVHG
eukprot:gnl/MRDRNA2_/MRDRNA2_193816_c0_seq1.p1 gnl/MRDRNA2_/MRDRNA2_193816_c0~~gnl/MRDRNA2_/MRDRNA2_193816_c0_seq1.p1  ORF type:complete len:453 (+),score=44.34 gnl/MRDRNA2_/MRDRNA2_193816_c0_seq1:112-1470(+)